MRRFWTCAALALAAAAPGIALRLTGRDIGPTAEAAAYGISLLGAGFLLSWSAEAAEERVSRGIALAALALVTVLPEYAVDAWYALQAGRRPGSEYTGLAIANMTGANRLLIGAVWPIVVVLFCVRTAGRGRSVALHADNAVEIAYLALASLYGLVLVGKGRIDLLDAVALGLLFAAYLWRIGRLRKTHIDTEHDDGDDEVGPAAVLPALPPRRQWAITGVLTVAAAVIIVAVAAPFARSLVATGAAFGVNRFLLVQWVAPLAGEAPEVVIAVLFTLARRPAAALGALISDKINQWTLLVGMLPVFVSIGAGGARYLPLDARQHEELFLTAAQSVFAVALLVRMRLTLRSAVALFVLFAVQLIVALICRQDEPRTIAALTGAAWLYIAMAACVLAANGPGLRRLVRFGLFGLEPAGSPEREGSRTEQG